MTALRLFVITLRGCDQEAVAAPTITAAMRHAVACANKEEGAGTEWTIDDVETVSEVCGTFLGAVEVLDELSARRPRGRWYDRPESNRRNGCVKEDKMTEALIKLGNQVKVLQSGQVGTIIGVAHYLDGSSRVLVGHDHRESWLMPQHLDGIDS